MATPSINDPRFSLVMKIAQNLYEAALANGATNLNPPSLNDTEDTLWKKSTYYSARLADA